MNTQHNPKFRILAALLLALAVFFIGAAFMPQSAAAADNPPSGWWQCDPLAEGPSGEQPSQGKCQDQADKRLAAFGYAAASWGDPNGAYAHMMGAVKPNGEGLFSHCSASMAAFWEGSDCYPIEKDLVLTSDATCNGWSVTAETSVEGASLSFNPADSGMWVGEYADGQNVTVTVTATWASGEIVTKSVTIARPDCRVRNLVLTSDATCNGWSVTAETSVEGASLSFNPADSGMWVGEYADGQNVTVTVTATWASGESVTKSVTIARPDCRVRNLVLTSDATCNGWSVTAETSVEGASLSFNPADSGMWVGEYADGQNVTVTVTATWASGESVTKSVTIARPDCRVPQGPVCDGGPGKIDVVVFWDLDGDGFLDEEGEPQVAGDGWGVQLQTANLAYMQLHQIPVLPEWTTATPGWVLKGVNAMHPSLGIAQATQTRVWVPDRSNVDGLDPWHFYPRGGQHGYWRTFASLNRQQEVQVRPCDDIVIAHGLVPGQTIAVFEAAPEAAAETAYVLNADGTYTIRTGDTVSSIATAFGQSMMDVLSWNGLEYTPGQPVIISVGQTLVVTPPAG